MSKDERNCPYCHTKENYVHISDCFVLDEEKTPLLYLSEKLSILSRDVAAFTLTHPSTKLSNFQVRTEKIRTGEKVQYECTIDITTDLSITEWRKEQKDTNLQRIDKSLLEGISQ